MTAADGEGTLAGTESGEATGDPERTAAAAEPLRGEQVDRYVVLGKLGAGGMGVVFAAYDPELDRKVALKLLHARGDEDGAAGRRLLAEAQALGRLAHPNVVAVHDVGTVQGRVWIAMEFVEGRTLGAWLGERNRSWRDVLAVFRPVLRGLAAAHAVGLVHRDVKPDNVMVANDGRVRVMDFGVARSNRPTTEEIPRDDVTTPQLRALDVRLTRIGAMVGTPRYMAPEQLAGTEVDARTDQFSACVMLWEALHGERPFAGDSFPELAASVLDGRIRPPPTGSNVPRWLRAIVRRGLEREPERRYATTEALIDAIARGQARARTGKAIAAIAAVGVGGAGVLGAIELDRRATTHGCEATGAAIAEVWNDEARERMRDGMLATGVVHAGLTAEKVVPWLDAHAQAWSGARTESCLDAELRQRWGADMLDRSLWCLDDRRMELAAIVEQLTAADARVIDRAVAAATSLSPIDPCRDAALLARLPAPPPLERRGDLDLVRAGLSEARALQRAGKFADGVALARELEARADALEWPPLSAAVRSVQMRLLGSAGAHEEAERVGRQAFFQAAKLGAWDVAATTATHLVYVVGWQRAQHAEGLSWAEHAEVALAHAGDQVGLREATRLGTVANVYAAQGELVRARELQERALAMKESVHGPEHPDLAMNLGNLANILYAMGDFTGARALNERALAIEERALGPEHPDVAISLNNLANTYWATGDYAKARELQERGLAAREKVLGPEHPDVAAGLSNLAAVHLAMGDHPRALELHRRALDIRERKLGPDHPDVGKSLNNLARVEFETGAPERARALQERALAVFEKSLAPDHPDVALAMSNLGTMLEAVRDFDRAREMYERALAIRQKTLGSEHPEVAMTLHNLGNVASATGDTAGARGLHERALAIREKALGPDHPFVGLSLVHVADDFLTLRDPSAALPLAERGVAILDREQGLQEGESMGRFVLARALWTAGDRVRAREQAGRALEELRTGTGSDEKLRETVDRWLAGHPPS